MDIYCVKIRQRRFPDKTYFPFERLYIVPEEFITSGHWKRVFEHMLVVESPEPVLQLLDKITISRKSEIADKRSPEVTGSWNGNWNPSKTTAILPDMKTHRIVIPTYVHKNKLGYVWSYLKNATMRGLDLSLYLPDRVIPSICYLCANLSYKYAGECSPSTEKCRVLAQLDLTTRKEEESAERVL